MKNEDVIKKYITQDKNKFEIALDIFNTFPTIKDDIVNDIYSVIIKTVKDHAKAEGKSFEEIIPYLGYTHNQYIGFKLKDDVLLQAAYSNYFRYLAINVRCGSEKNNFGKDKDFLQTIKSLYQDAPNIEIRQQYNDTHIKILDYPYNKIDNMIKLFELYKDEKQKDNLKDVTKQYLSLNIIKLVNFFETYKM